MRLEFLVAGVGRQFLVEVHEVPVDVDVVFIRPVPVREAVRVDRMDQQQRDARRPQPAQQFIVMQQGDLASGAAIPFNAMGG